MIQVRLRFFIEVLILISWFADCKIMYVQVKISHFSLINAPCFFILTFDAYALLFLLYFLVSMMLLLSLLFCCLLGLLLVEAEFVIYQGATLTSYLSCFLKFCHPNCFWHADCTNSTVLAPHTVVKWLVSLKVTRFPH
jgi:hypothetical protein